MIVHVICKNAAGEPDIYTTDMPASAIDLRDGDHYERARAAAADAGYESTVNCICVDEMDHLFRRILPTT